MERIFLNNAWEFVSEYSDELLSIEYDGKVENIRIPHTTKEVPFHYFDESEYQMICGYRKIIDAPIEWKENRVILTFEGVAHFAEVYLNGKKIADHKSGYTAFSTELTDYLNYGERNILVVKVDSHENLNTPPFGFVVDYMTFGGIYRDVYLDIKNQDYIEDIFVAAEFEENSIGESEAIEVNLKTNIKLNTINHENAAFFIRTYICKDGKRVALGDKPVDGEIISFTKKLKNIKLWDIENPELYQIEFELYKDTEIIDIYSVMHGFRKAEFKKDGFFLNNKKVKIRGLNRHQSYPYVGYAMPKSMQEYDVDILKIELGCNAVRTSHYPQSQHFINRCDEIGLLVFMEFPGWQHIGDEEWKEQACINLQEMIMQYRNHASIILWGVRINESPDDDQFYEKTNRIAHELDWSRQTGGVRCIKNSNMFEDVYTYNDFVHSGQNVGCEPKKKVTSQINKAYLVSEYNGHMYPTKMFDDEEQRREHALRHARVLNDITAYDDIAGSFGWCMFDYNTHKDFGSGDRICYHGVMDMFRNPKLAANIYKCEQEDIPVLEISSSMDIGEHPGCNRGSTYIFSNADSVKMYKNDKFIKEYTKKDSPYKALKHGPMLIDDFIGNQIAENEAFTKKQAEMITYALNYTATHGYGNYPFKVIMSAIKCILFYHMKPSDAISLFNKYVGDWGGTSTIYKFEAIKEGKVVKTVIKEPMKKMHIDISASHTKLKEETSYDVSALRIKVLDENNNQMYFYSDPVEIETEGPIEVIGPKIIPVRGGTTGTYIRTISREGIASVKIGNSQIGYKKIEFSIGG